MDHKSRGSAASGPNCITSIVSNRMMLGVFSTIFYQHHHRFFLTWFPIYLVQEKACRFRKGLVASIPVLCGFAGGVLEVSSRLSDQTRFVPDPGTVTNCAGNVAGLPSSYVTTPTKLRWWSRDGAGFLWRFGALAGQ